MKKERGLCGYIYIYKGRKEREVGWRLYDEYTNLTSTSLQDKTDTSLWVVVSPTRRVFQGMSRIHGKVSPGRTRERERDRGEER